MKIIRKPRYTLKMKTKEHTRCALALDRLFEHIDTAEKAKDAFGWTPKEFKAMEDLMYKFVNVPR